MLPTRISGEIGASDLICILFYRLKTLNDEERQQWYKEWAEINSRLPRGIKLIVECGNAFTTQYSGFAVYQGTITKFEKMLSMLETRTRHVLEDTYVVIGMKGRPIPTAELGTIMQQRPVD